jgi:hypothetical protein
MFKRIISNSVAMTAIMFFAGSTIGVTMNCGELCDTFFKKDACPISKKICSQKTVENPFDKFKVPTYAENK